MEEFLKTQGKEAVLLAGIFLRLSEQKQVSAFDNCADIRLWILKRVGSYSINWGTCHFWTNSVILTGKSASKCSSILSAVVLFWQTRKWRKDELNWEFFNLVIFRRWVSNLALNVLLFSGTPELGGKRFAVCIKKYAG